MPDPAAWQHVIKLWEPWLVAAVTVAVTLVVTYLSTTIKWRRAGSSQLSEPPPAPYWIPLLGNTVAFAYNTEQYLQSLL
jgi:hypothetical protein